MQQTPILTQRSAFLVYTLDAWSQDSPVLADRAAGSLVRFRESQEFPDATSPITTDATSPITS